MTKKALELFIISDAIGETAQKVITAVLAQFPDLTTVETKRFSFIDSKEELLRILQDAHTVQAIVISTMVDTELNQLAQQFADEHQLHYLDYMSPLMQLIETQTGCTPRREARAQYKLTHDYFSKIEAIEFAVKYDDGRDPRGFLKADYVILGISRTSKTPLSMYLANKGYKVANLPLVPNIPVPKELYEVPRERIVGLLADPHDVLITRKTRMQTLGLTNHSTYTDLANIQSELDFARSLYRQLGARTVSIDNMAIEEIAEAITGNQKTRN